MCEQRNNKLIVETTTPETKTAKEILEHIRSPKIKMTYKTEIDLTSLGCFEVLHLETTQLTGMKISLIWSGDENVGDDDNANDDDDTSDLKGALKSPYLTPGTNPVD